MFLAPLRAHTPPRAMGLVGRRVADGCRIEDHEVGPHPRLSTPRSVRREAARQRVMLLRPKSSALPQLPRGGLNRKRKARIGFTPPRASSRKRGVSPMLKQTDGRTRP